MVHQTERIDRPVAGVGTGPEPTKFAGRVRGFSLTELVVVLLAISVLTAIAVPSYRGHVADARRATARAALSDGASRQEQFALNTRTYTTTVGAGGLGTATTTDGGHYAIAVDAPTAGCPIARCFVLRATPQGAQSGDACGAMTFASNGDRAPSGCW